MARRKNIDDFLNNEIALEDIETEDTVTEENSEDSEIQEEFGEFLEIENQEDPSRELYEGGPTVQQLNEWKEQYGDIFITAVAYEMYIWRCLTRKEYKKSISDYSTAYEREECYANTCVLWPQDIDFDSDDIKAGLPSTLAEQILMKSGFQVDYAPIQL